MIVWLNGPFGAGKTAVARELCAQDASLLLFDSELVGDLLRRILGGRKPVGDFTEWAPWVPLVVATARELAVDLGCDLVIPQTVLSAGRWDELMSGFASHDLSVRAFTLDVAVAELERRIDADAAEVAAREWRRAHIQAYQAARPWLAEGTRMLDATGHSAVELAALIVGELRHGA